MVASRITIIDYLGKWETTQQQQIQSLEGCEKHAALKMKPKLGYSIFLSFHVQWPCDHSSFNASGYCKDSNPEPKIY